MLEHIRVVLVEPSHPGNIGAVARAMKNMGLTRLVLVNPEQFPHATATERASGADDVLAKAQVVSSLEEALMNCQWVYGTSARQRSFAWPQLTPRQAVEKMIPLSRQHEIAVVFGPERAGLPNEALQRCDYHIAIPTHPGYSSLNLSMAVQVVAYEIYQRWLQEEDQPSTPLGETYEKATADQVAGLVAHFEEASIALGFMDPAHPKKLLPRLKRFFARAQLEMEEVNILRGFLKLVLQRVSARSS